jgi:hypothetical protein
MRNGIMSEVEPPSVDILQAFGTTNHPVSIAGGQKLFSVPLNNKAKGIKNERRKLLD